MERVSEGGSEMGERATRKGKRQPAQRQRGVRTATAASTRNNGLNALEAVERERDQLKAQLSEALARIAKLEKARDEALNRIDWAIDSLHNVLEGDA